MEVFFNELSCKPFAEDISIAKERIISLLYTLKELRKEGITIMRAHSGFYTHELCENYSFTDFFNDSSVDKTLKTLLKGITKTPYIEDEDSYEAEIFILSDFKTVNEKDELISPEGIASAYIYNSPAVSLNSHACWQKNNLELIITDHKNKDNPKTELVLNAYSTECATSAIFMAWFKKLVDDVKLNSEANIYKIFPAGKFEFDARAIEDLVSWYYDDKRFILRIKDLISDISDHPFTGGIGHTESLSGTGGKASKRIIKKDRLVYTYTDGKITIHQCKGHYDDN